MKLNSSKIVYHQKFPNGKEIAATAVLVYDLRLERVLPDFQKFRKGFAFSYPVKAGEELKSLSNFPKHVEALLQKTDGFAGITFVSLGGGSVGDFVGFIASVYKRGARLIHIPTTWLAALDSSHGGKTGLNVGSRKNQIGTFYPASEVHLVQDILERQPQKLTSDAMGELVKIAMIQGGALWNDLGNGATLWEVLPKAILAKLKVVKRDPYETQGQRRILNLGHTLGHVLEIEMGLSHGAAVAQGIFFALEWGKNRGSLSPKNYDACISRMALLGLKKLSGQDLRRVPSYQAAVNLLRADKKGAGAEKLHFVFVQRPGKVFQEKVLISDVLLEAKRQGFVV